MKVTSILFVLTMLFTGCTDSITNDIMASVKKTQIVIPPETELKVSKDETARVHGFSDVEDSDYFGIHKMSNAIVIYDGIDKVDVVIDSPKPQNKETWHVVRDGTKIQLVRPNGFVVQLVSTHR